jgi:hypothetical protein
MSALHQAREVVVDHLEIPLDALGVPACIGSNAQILLHGEALQHLTPFHDLDNPQAANPLGVPTIDAPPHELDAAVGHFAVLGFEQAGDGFQRCRLASPISAEQGHDLAFRNFQRQPLQDEDHLAIDHLDIV